MTKVIILMFALFLSFGEAQAEKCIRKYKQPNGITAYGEVECAADSNGSASQQTQQKSPAQASAAFFGGVGKSVSLNFQNIEIRSLMQVFSDVSNKRFFVDDTVVGAVNIVSNNVPWNEALVNMLFPNHLVVVKIRSGFYVCPDSMSDELCGRRAASKGL